MHPPHDTLRAGLLALIFAAAGFGLGAPATAQVAPDARWYTLRTEHFRVTFPGGLEDVARHVARRAEVRHAQLAERVAPPPAGVIDIVLADDRDLAGGAAMTFPSNRIVLHATPPLDRLSLAFYGDWLDLVLLHELAHIFHLDTARGLSRAVRAVFGRMPLAWPAFPGHASPTWVVEGLATFYESELTGFGRVHGSMFDMFLRTAALEDALDAIDEADGYDPRWPGAHRRYLLGALFFEFLAERHGEEFVAELVRRTARSLPPPYLVFDRLGRRTLGEPLTAAWDEWQDSLRARYAHVADSIAAQGVTRPETLTDRGHYELHGRVGPDGRVAFNAYDARSDRANLILDGGTGSVRRLARQNGPGPPAWLPDGSLLTSQLEFDGPHRIRRDLYRVSPDGREERLTRRARLAEPDVAADGRSVVAVEAEGATVRVVRYDLDSRELVPLAGFSPDTHWTLPRWAPDGRRIAVGRWSTGGTWDIVVMDDAGAVLHSIAAGPHVAAAPAWSPDGRYLLFWSDRTGIPNLFAADLAATDLATSRSEQARRTGPPPLFQVTNVLTGAFFPDVSADGAWIYFTGYHADGFHLQRIAFEPDAWRPVPAVPAASLVGSDSGSGHGALPARAPVDPAAQAVEVGPAERYGPGATLAPRYWMPTLNDRGRAGVFLGAFTSGRDLVGRHAFSAAVAASPLREVRDPDGSSRYERSDLRFAGRFIYNYAGLGNPVLGLDLERSWSFAGSVSFDDGSRRDVLVRDDDLAIGATLLRRGWRSSASLTLGADLGIHELALLDPPAGFPGFAKPRDDLLGLFARVGFGTARSHPFSISPEDGVSLSLGARRRWDRDATQVHRPDEPPVLIDRSYDEIRAFGAAYKGLDLPGFGRHVLAVRSSALLRTGPGARLHGVGGASGSPVDLGLTSFGSAGRFLPVRGFPADSRLGTRAWTATLEYRAPLALVGRGYRLWPAFLDRLSLAAFLDAGNAWCSDAESQASTLCPEQRLSPLVGAGAEIAVDLGLFYNPPTRLRFGAAFPVHGDEGRAGVYIRFGRAF